MKTNSVIAILAGLVATSALASGSPFSVKINSFTHIGDTSSTLGEVCGTVTVNNPQVMPGLGSLIPISVTADPNTSNPGIYTVLADQSGGFCVVINTYAGSASAEAWLPGSKVDTPVAQITHAKRN